MSTLGTSVHIGLLRSSSCSLCFFLEGPLRRLRSLRLISLSMSQGQENFDQQQKRCTTDQSLWLSAKLLFLFFLHHTCFHQLKFSCKGARRSKGEWGGREKRRAVFQQPLLHFWCKTILGRRIMKDLAISTESRRETITERNHVNL